MKITNFNNFYPNVLHFHGQNKTQLPRTFEYIFDNVQITPADFDQLAIISTWTNAQNCCLLQQCLKNNISIYNCVPDNYDTTQPWYMPNKIKFFLNLLEKITQPYILFLDGYDVLLTHLDDILDKFKEFNYDILFNPSCNNYPDVLIDIIPNRTQKGVYRYFNAGCCIGKREALIKFYKEALEYIDIANPLNSEQFIMRHAFAKYSKDPKQRFVGIDHDCKIFQSMGVLDCNIDYNNGTIEMLPNKIPRKHVIVTGSDGFIGKELVNKLKYDQNNVVYEVDRKRGLEVKYVEFLFAMKEIDCVYHLAAQTSVFNEDNQQIVSDNIADFVKIVDLCSKYGTKLVYVSSSTANDSNTTSLYGLSKKFDEEYARLYYPDAVGIRLHNVYGKNPREGTLLWHLLNDKETILYNNGQNKRSFTYIDDAVNGLLSGYNLEGGLYNCVNLETWTTEEFSKEACKYNENIKYRCVPEIRNKDNLLQEVNKGIPLIKMNYISIQEGIKRSLI